MNHQTLSFTGEYSLGYRWRCPVCGEELRSAKDQSTNWQTWYFTKSGKRHFKSRCNLQSSSAKRQPAATLADAETGKAETTAKRGTLDNLQLSLDNMRLQENEATIIVSCTQPSSKAEINMR